MAKISVISPDLSEACYIYRGRAWTQLGHDFRTYDGKKGFALFDAVMFADTVVLLRPFTKQQVGIAQTVKDCGKRLIIDFDDSYVNIPRWNPNAHHFKGCQPVIEELSRLADAVTVSSEALKVEIESYGAKRVVEIKNAIDDSLKGIYRAPERSKSLMWRGSSTHSADIESGKQTFFDFAEKGYEIIFFGDSPPWGYQVKHRVFSASDYSNFLCTMAKLAPEYMFVPLVDHPFNHAKSDCAASEAYLIGAKLIHSNIGEFKGLPEVGEPRWLSDVNHKRMELINSL